MSELAIRVENLGKKYEINKASDTLTGSFKNLFATREKESFWALDDVSFEIKEGESIGIIGRNGAGKSTLLKILSKITPPTCGRATIKGKVSSLLEVGTGFHPELTGRENVFLNGALLGMSRPEIKSKLEEIIDFSGIERFIDTPVKKYSSGMYVRLAFSVAAHLDSDVLLIDEILAVGDLKYERKGVSKMKSIADNGKTIVFVSHNLELLSKFCKKSILLSEGKILDMDSTMNIIDKYHQITDFTSGKENFSFNNIEQDGGKEFGIISCSYRSNTKENNIVNTGEKFSILVKYRSNANLEDVEVGFVLKDELGKPILGLNNVHLGQSISIKRGEGIVIISIPNFPICTASKVYVDLFFGKTSYKYECLENAFSFEIFHNSFYNGRLIDRTKNIFLVEGITIEKVQ